MDQITNQLIAAALPHIASAAVIAASTVIAWLYARVTKRTLEKSAQADLHSALETIAGVVFDMEMTTDAKIDAMVDYASKSVPDALKKLSPSTDVLQSLAMSKLKKLLPGIL